MTPGKFSIVACGPRGDARNEFRLAHEIASGIRYVALLIDSESPVVNIDKTWDHLAVHDRWEKPQGAQNDQVMFMTTCMETWIVADRTALREQFGPDLQTGELPPIDNLEERRPGYLKDRLESATRLCPSPYKKGLIAFAVLVNLDPGGLEDSLPSFRRARRILTAKLT